LLHPDVEEEVLNRRFGSPYFKTIEYHKRFAKEVLDAFAAQCG